MQSLILTAATFVLLLFATPTKPKVSDSVSEIKKHESCGITLSARRLASRSTDLDCQQFLPAKIQIPWQNISQFGRKLERKKQSNPKKI